MKAPLYEYRSLPWIENGAGTLQSGRVLIRLDSDEENRLDFYNADDSKLPAYLIYIILKILLGVEWIGKLESMHQNRPNAWKTKVYSGPQGIHEYRLYSIKQDIPICSSLITVTDSQIETFSVYAEDAAPLLKKIIEDFPPVFLPRLLNHRYTYFFPNFYPYPVDRRCLAFPEPIKMQRELTQNIRIPEDIFPENFMLAGQTSGIIETVEALKCMEVLQA